MARRTRKPKFPKHRNVFRIDVRGTHGWQVRIQRQGESHTKFFGDNIYGSQEEALKEAVVYRDNLLEELPEPASTHEHLHLAENRRKAAEAINRSGVHGVGFTMSTGKGGQKWPYVQGYWSDTDGRRRCTKASVEKHGLEGALRIVCDKLVQGRNDQNVDVDDLVDKALPGITRLYEEEAANGQA